VTTTNPRVNRYVPELDGVRGIAILLVMIFHFGVEHTGPERWYNLWIRFGWCGVDLFFVLSGFLITRILLRTRHVHGYFSRFYVRRVLRIFPLYYAVLGLAFWIVIPWLNQFGYLNGLRAEQPWYWLYVANWRTGYGHFSGSPLGHFWTLAIEEQFYLVWPVVVWLMPEEWLIRVCLTVPLISVGLRQIPQIRDAALVSPEFFYRLTPFRLDGLVLGAAIAILLRHPKWLVRASRGVPWLLMGSLSMLAFVLWWDGTASQFGPLLSRFGINVLDLLFACGLFLLVTRGTGSGLLRGRALRSLGKYSYAIYIIHQPISLVFNERYRRFGLGPALEFIAIGIPFCWFLAWLSWNAFEKHFLRLKDRLAPEPLTPTPEASVLH
jgi:peptidoglycan/LPS O-acetylase OafA/YrhL